MATVSKPGFLATDTQYHSVSSMTESYDPEAEEVAFEPKMELGDHPPASMNRGWLTTILLQFLSLLWLVPILALLILNLQGHIIGASACECYCLITRRARILITGVRVPRWTLLGRGS